MRGTGFDFNKAENVALPANQINLTTAAGGGKFAAAQDVSTGARRKVGSSLPPREGQLNNFVTHIWSRRPGIFVSDDLHTDHQASSAHIADYSMFFHPRLHALHHVITDLGSVLNTFALQHIHGCERRRDANRITS